MERVSKNKKKCIQLPKLLKIFINLNLSGLKNFKAITITVSLIISFKF